MGEGGTLDVLLLGADKWSAGGSGKSLPLPFPPAGGAGEAAPLGSDVADVVRDEADGMAGDPEREDEAPVPAGSMRSDPSGPMY